MLKSAFFGAITVGMALCLSISTPALADDDRHRVEDSTTACSSTIEAAPRTPRMHRGIASDAIIGTSTLCIIMDTIAITSIMCIVMAIITSHTAAFTLALSSVALLAIRSIHMDITCTCMAHTVQ